MGGGGWLGADELVKRAAETSSVEENVHPQTLHIPSLLEEESPNNMSNKCPFPSGHKNNI